MIVNTPTDQTDVIDSGQGQEPSGHLFTIDVNLFQNIVYNVNNVNNVNNVQMKIM